MGIQPVGELDLTLPDGTLAQLGELFARHGDFFPVHARSIDEPIFVLANPEDIAYVLSKNHRNYIKGIGIERVALLLGRGLMISDGELWRRQRKLIQPAFHRALLLRYAMRIVRHNYLLVESWQELAGTPAGTIELEPEMSRLALSCVLTSLFGQEHERLREQHGHDPFAVVSAHAARDLEFVEKLVELRQLLRQVVQARRAQQRPETPPLDVLDLLLAGSPGDATLDDDLLLDELVTLIVAGHETTASSLTSLWYFLDRHPAAATALRAELGRVLGGRLPMFGDLESLVYTQAVVCETMRLHPAAWILSRRALAADTLRGRHIPAGAQLLLSPYLLHRHPDYWPEPTRFLPERFAQQPLDLRARPHFIPFSVGPRRCIGDSLALVEMVLHLATVTQELELVAEERVPAQLAARINLRMTNPPRMRLVTRKRS